MKLSKLTNILLEIKKNIENEDEDGKDVDVGVILADDRGDPIDIIDVSSFSVTGNVILWASNDVSDDEEDI